MSKLGIDYYKNLNYKVDINQKDGLFYLKIKELKLVESGKKLEETYLRLMESKDAYIEIMYARDEENSIPLPVANKVFKDWSRGDIKRFAIKCFIISFFALVVLEITYDEVRPTAESLAKAIGSIKTLPARIKKIANEPEEKIFLSKLFFHNTLQSTRPFVQEIKSVWINENVVLPEGELKESDIGFLQNYLNKLRDKTSRTEVENKQLQNLVLLINNMNEYLENALSRGNYEEVGYYKKQLKLYIENIKRAEGDLNHSTHDPVLLKLKNLKIGN